MIISDAKAEGQRSYRPRRIQNPLLWGGGAYVHYSNQPSAQCKGRSDPFTETPRSGPLSPEDRARRVAQLRAVLAAPAFQARLRAGEQGEQP